VTVPGQWIVPAAPLPQRIVPMQPELASEPFHHPGWVYEEKLDGWRMIACKDRPRVRLVSRSGVDHTARFPGIVAALAGLLAPQLILDGEVCVFDDQLVSQFHCWDGAGRDLIYPARRLPRPRAGSVGRGEGARLGGPSGEGPERALHRGRHRALAQGEGAARGPVHRGWRHAVGSQVTGLLVGQRQRGRLLYRGTVEWGLFRQVVTQLVASVEGLVRSTSPFADLRRAPEVTWLEPRLLAEVSYSEIMEDRLRDPVLRELRVAR
jgi:ATP-dependent DNA ligase